MKTLATHLFLPDESNNQRPKLLHPQAVMIYVVVFFILQLSFRVGKFVYPDILGFATNITIEKLFALTNQERQEKGLNPLNLDPNLSAAAFEKAQDMFVDNYWAHVAPDGITPWQFIEKEDYAYLYAGENLAKDFADSQGVVSAWMASSSHRDNILKKEYRDIGFGVVNGKLNGQETTLVVQMFGQKKSLAQKTPFVSSQTTAAQTFLTPTPFISPSPAITGVSPVVFASFTDLKKPLIDVLTLERAFSLGLLMLLLSILIVDGVFVIKRKTVRVVGHNISHIIFLTALISLLFLTKKGVVL